MCFVDFCRALRGTHNSTRATHGPGIHNFAHGSDVPALLTSPLGCAGATGTATTSAVAAGESRTGGTSGPSTDDHAGEVGLSTTG
jgi:hypothetical protein